MATADTLMLDSLQIARWQHDDRYDYDRELVSGKGVGSWLTDHIRRFLSDLFNTTIESDTVVYLLIFAGAVVAGVVAWLLWKRGGSVFFWRKERTPLDYTVEEDTIYGVDFEAEQARALAQGDYRQAVRWLYLQTLAALSDAGKIDWQPQKTPMQYMREARDDAFSQLSRHFVRVRYGNFEATPELYEEMKQLRQAVGKGGVRL